MCLNEFIIPYSFYNVLASLGNNTITYYIPNSSNVPVAYSFTLDDGFYDTPEINTRLQATMKENGHYWINAPKTSFSGTITGTNLLTVATATTYLTIGQLITYSTGGVVYTTTIVSHNGIMTYNITSGSTNTTTTAMTAQNTNIATLSATSFLYPLSISYYNHTYTNQITAITIPTASNIVSTFGTTYLQSSNWAGGYPTSGNQFASLFIPTSTSSTYNLGNILGYIGGYYPSNISSSVNVITGSSTSSSTSVSVSSPTGINTGTLSIVSGTGISGSPTVSTIATGTTYTATSAGGTSSSTNVYLTAPNSNIVQNQVVSGTGIVQPCFVSSYTAGSSVVVTNTNGVSGSTQINVLQANFASIVPNMVISGGAGYVVSTNTSSVVATPTAPATLTGFITITGGTSGILVGMIVTGTGIGAGCYVTSVAPNVVSISNAQTTSTSNALTFTLYNITMSTTNTFGIGASITFNLYTVALSSSQSINAGTSLSFILYTLTMSSSQSITAGTSLTITNYNSSSATSQVISGNTLQQSPPYPALGSFVNGIVVRCNLIENAVAIPSDILDSFSITSGFGSNINYQPNYEKWVGIKAGKFNKLTITLTDQNFNNLGVNDTNVLISLFLKFPKKA